MIDDDEDEAQEDDRDELYESEYEVQDPDCPYPSVVAELNLDLETEVLNVAVPSILPPSVPQLPAFAKEHMIAALVCADGRVKVVSIPLAPPVPGTHEAYVQEYVNDIDLQASKAISRDLAIKITPKDDDALDEQDVNSDEDGKLLIASVSPALNIWSLPISADSISQSSTSTSPIVHSPVSGSKVTFQSSPRQTNLLVSEPSGSVRIFSPFSQPRRPLSRDSASAGPTSAQDPGYWIMSYQTPFHAPENGNPVLARRKKILSAAWTLGGRGIIVLLEDGQWGIWDMSSNSQTSDRSVQDFALQGYLSTSTTSDTASAAPQKRNSGTKLAPMTPNTRKAKAENLFAGPSKPASAAPSGGISVSSMMNRAGQLDESIMIWYNNSIYSIPSVQTFWQRSTSNRGSGDKDSFGGLYAPGLTHVSDINLMNENITSISQFAPKSAISTAVMGQINMQRDVLVSAEHRYVILQHLRAQASGREQLQLSQERVGARDQRMLDAGESDLGGLNRIMDGMTGEGRVRRVGFAA